MDSLTLTLLTPFVPSVGERMSACSDTVAGSRLLTPFVLSVAERSRRTRSWSEAPCREPR